MLYSIRWRLIASFTLLTLLTVTLLGVMVLTLMQRSLEQQASESLHANAEAVAHQSLALFQPAPQATELHQLAHTVAFLSDAQVRILDEQKQVLADSGAPARQGEFTWFMRRPNYPPLPDHAPPAMFVLTAPPELVAPGFSEELTFSQTIDRKSEPALHDIVSIYKMSRPWGDRLLFQTIAPDESLSITRITSVTADAWRPSAGNLVEIARSPLQVVAPIQANNQVMGYVELSSAPNLVAAMLAIIRRAFLIAAALVSGVAVVVGWVVSRGLTAPLEGLAQATMRMNEGELSARAPVHGKDEIGLLARRFNQMAAALESSFAALAIERDALRRFIADASHELRTPITALRTFHELLLGGAAQDAQAQREFLLEGQSQVERLEHITNNLLNLSRLEGGLVQLELADHDLCEVVSAVVSGFKTVAQERQIDLRVELAQPTIPVRCDRSQLETALINLVDNALKFTPAGGQVQVGAQLNEQIVHLWVKDNGPGIAPEELPHIFERFQRGRQATSTGSGLGLAIVQSITHAHGGQVEVASQVGVGSRFTIRLNS
jgi:signal transduction histidine kinase